jgi:hypothetical protein
MGFILGDVLLRTMSQSPAPTDNSRFACSEKRTTGRALARKSSEEKFRPRANRKRADGQSIASRSDMSTGT